MIFLQIIFGLFLLGFIFWVGSHLYSLIFYAPYINASKQAIGDALKFSGLKKNDIFVDLGSGNGSALILANKKFGARSYGFEISPFPYLISKIKTFGNKKIKIYYGDYKKAEKLLCDADVVYLYLLNSVLDKIEDWLFENINNNTKIISLAFKFKKHQPIKTISTANLGRKTKIWLYAK